MDNLRFVVRLLGRNPLIFLTNVVGLSIALTTVILTLTYIRYELSYDRHFVTRDRVVRLYSRVTNETRSSVFGISLRQAYTQIPGSVPEVESAVQLYGGWPAPVQYNENRLGNVRLFYADKEIFEVFGLTLITGDEQTALIGSNSAVITGSLAEKLFNTTNCIGNTIEADGEQVMITGVMNELPVNSHFTFDVLVSLSTIHPEEFGGLEFQTYFLLKPNVDRKTAIAKISAANDLVMQDWASATNSTIASGVEPLTDLYLNSVVSQAIPNHGSWKQLVIVGMIALFVLFTALISYINLFIIQGEKRIAEISTRTMFGATKINIAWLFLLETAIVFLVSAVLAFLITYYTLPYVSGILLSKVSLPDLFSGWGIGSMFIVLAILLAISSGYPVLYLSRMKFALGLRGKISGTTRNSWLSTASVLVQFTVVTMFVSCMIIILSQLGYMRKVPLGFNVHDIITVRNCSNTISRKYESLKNELLKLPFITNVSGGEHFMGGGCSGQYIRNTGDGERNNKGINEYREKPGFGELMQLRLVDGRFFRESMADSQAIILNESAINMLGLEPKAGQPVLYNDERVTIIGVVKNFYFMSHPGESIPPLSIANCYRGTPNIFLRSKGMLTPEQLDQVKGIFLAFDPDYVFTMSVLTDVFDRMYRKENRLATMVSIGGAQVVAISLISLLALTILKISRRTREVGIRKANGSSVNQVISTLVKETVIIVAIAVFIASTASYIVMHGWLMDYTNHIRLHPGYFLLSALFVLTLALCATIWQAWRAATRNPVEALRHE